MIKRSRKLAIGFGLLLAVGSTVPALAQPASSGGTQPYPQACTNVSADQSDRAHKLYEAGKAYYDDNNNDAAIAQFREAYKKDCAKHELLIIISRAYQLKGDLAEAIRALETYLERQPNSLDAGSLKTRIDNMRKQLTAQPPPTATATATAAPTSTTAPPPGEIREHTLPPWIVVGVGAAGIVTGIILLVAAPAFPKDCDKTTETCRPLKNVPNTADETSTSPGFQTRQDKAGQSVGFTLGGTIAIIAGVAVVGGGLLWHFLEPTGRAEVTTGKTKPKLTPALAPGYAGLSLGGTF